MPPRQAPRTQALRGTSERCVPAFFRAVLRVKPASQRLTPKRAQCAEGRNKQQQQEDRALFAPNPRIMNPQQLDAGECVALALFPSALLATRAAPLAGLSLGSLVFH